jgi:hypothetical protein
MVKVKTQFSYRFLKLCDASVVSLAWYGIAAELLGRSKYD